MPTGVSMRCAPGLMRPMCASVTIRPMVPWPHMPMVPTLLKKITPALRRRVDRLDQQRADDDVRAARLVHRRGAEAVELALQALAALGERAAAEVGTAGDDDPRRLAAGVRVDDLQLFHLLRLDAELLGELAELLDLGADHAR